MLPGFVDDRRGAEQQMEARLHNRLRLQVTSCWTCENDADPNFGLLVTI